MQTKSSSRVACLNLRVLIRFSLCVASLVMAFTPMRSTGARENAAAQLSPSSPAHLVEAA
jgi:hypothetical protein